MGRIGLGYLAAAHGVLEAAGLWQGELYELAGVTGLAFQFIVHETACPSSTTVYDWGQSHYLKRPETAAVLYRRVAAAFESMKTFASFQGLEKTTIDSARLPELPAKAKECRQWESEAMEEIGRLLKA